MKICNQCKIEFKPCGRESCCSIKCRLIYGTIKEGDCWIWQGSTAGDYGKIRWNGITFSTHKTSFRVFRGEVPSGMWVCHSCDIPLCINPEHLFLGSPSDNRRDASNKKRLPSGQFHQWSFLTDLQIEEIRLLKNENFSYARLARIFNCSVTHLYNVVKNKIRKG